MHHHHTANHQLGTMLICKVYPIELGATVKEFTSSTVDATSATTEATIMSLVVQECNKHKANEDVIAQQTVP
jgi:hypothetical protein